MTSICFQTITKFASVKLALSIRDTKSHYILIHDCSNPVIPAFIPCMHINHQHYKPIPSISLSESTTLSLLLNSRRGRWSAICRFRAVPTALLFCRPLIIISTVIVVLVHLHLSCGRLIHRRLLRRNRLH